MLFGSISLEAREDADRQTPSLPSNSATARGECPEELGSDGGWQHTSSYSGMEQPPWKQFSEKGLLQLTLGGLSHRKF